MYCACPEDQSPGACASALALLSRRIRRAFCLLAMRMYSSLTLGAPGLPCTGSGASTWGFPSPVSAVFQSLP
eukprot:14064227-Heterocapsa_arctica.AAC.1